MSNKNLSILNNFSILYLEDDKDLLKNTKDILDDYFANVFGVSAIKDAYFILKQKKVDVIISDILLKNENGLDFIKATNNLNIPVILTTAHTNTEYLLESIKLKVNRYMIKPIDFNILMESLYEILHPIYQNKDLIKDEYIIKIISIVLNNKQINVIKYMMNNLNKDNEFISSYLDITGKIDISKPTLIKLFKILAERKIFTKISHKTYKFQEKNLAKL